MPFSSNIMSVAGALQSVVECTMPDTSGLCFTKSEDCDYRTSQRQLLMICSETWTTEP